MLLHKEPVLARAQLISLWALRTIWMAYNWTQRRHSLSDPKSWEINPMQPKSGMGVTPGGPQPTSPMPSQVPGTSPSNGSGPGTAMMPGSDYDMGGGSGVGGPTGG